MTLCAVFLRLTILLFFLKKPRLAASKKCLPSVPDLVSGQIEIWMFST